MPRRKASWADELVLLPWWVSFGVAAFAWLFLPAMLPQPMRGLAAIATIFFGAMACISALRSWQTGRMLEQQTDLQSLRELSPKRFEDLLGEAYRRQGYEVEETLGGGADGGVDLVLSREGGVTIVQCKRWKGKPVPVQTVRELYGVLNHKRASAAKLVATTTFTREAVVFAEGKPIELVDANALLQLLRSVQTSGKIVLPPAGARDHLAPSCPRCGAKMKMRLAKHGTHAGERFWGCPNYPSCRGTREI
jgi:restriction system protein